MIRSAALACAVAACIAAPAHGLELSHGALDNGMIYIEASGEIDNSDPAKFVAYVIKNRLRGAALVLSSDGGSVAAGMTIGRYLRAAGMTVLIPGDSRCFSACTFVFVGGANRLMSKTARLGVHQFRWDGAADGMDVTGESQAVSAAVVDYFVEMGIDHRAATIGMTVPPAQMHVFTPEELVAFNLTTSEQAKSDAKVSRRSDCPWPDGYAVSDPLGLYPGCVK